jgi:hypothetical protein
MILPFIGGIGTTIGVSDVLYPTGGDERLATARVGAWVAGLAFVVFTSLEAFPADPAGASLLVIVAATSAAGVAIGHDVLVGPGLSPVVVFFIPAAVFALTNLLSPVRGPRKLLVNARGRLAAIGCGTAVAAAYIYFTAGTRGLVMDFVMIGAALACGVAVLVCAVLVWRETESAALVTLVAVGIGLITLRDYFIWQTAVLGGSAYLSHRIALSSPTPPVNADVTRVAPTDNSPVV